MKFSRAGGCRPAESGKLQLRPMNFRTSSPLLTSGGSATSVPTNIWPMLRRRTSTRFPIKSVLFTDANTVA
jgi:hypothetical protein